METCLGFYLSRSLKSFMQLRILQSSNICKFKSRQDEDFEWRLWMRSSSTQQGHFKLKFQIGSKCMQSFHCIFRIFLSTYKHFLHFASFYTISVTTIRTLWSLYFYFFFRNSYLTWKWPFWVIYCVIYYGNWIWLGNYR